MLYWYRFDTIILAFDENPVNGAFSQNDRLRAEHKGRAINPKEAFQYENERVEPVIYFCRHVYRINFL